MWRSGFSSWLVLSRTEAPRWEGVAEWTYLVSGNQEAEQGNGASQGGAGGQVHIVSKPRGVLINPLVKPQSNQLDIIKLKHHI